MNIILIQNKNLDKFEPDQQTMLRGALGHSDSWCGTVYSADTMRAIWDMCRRDLDTVMKLILSEFPADIATFPSVVLYHDEYLDAFGFKTRSEQKNLEVALIVAIHRTYANLCAADKTAGYLKARGISLVSSSEFLKLKNSVLEAENKLSEVSLAWPPFGHKSYDGVIRNLVDQVARAQEPAISGLREDMATLENRINALKEASVQVEQRMKEINPDDIKDSMDAVKGFTEELERAIAQRVESALLPGTPLFNELLKSFTGFLKESDEFKDFIAKLARSGEHAN